MALMSLHTAVNGSQARPLSQRVQSDNRSFITTYSNGNFENKQYYKHLRQHIAIIPALNI